MEHKEVEIRIKRIVRWQERLASAALGETAPLEVQYLPEAADAGAPPPRARSARESAERRPLAAPPVPEATGPEQPGVRPRPVSCLDPLLDFPFRIPGTGAPWRPMREGEAWGRAWDRAWFRLHGRVPAAWAGRRIVAHIDLGSEGLVLRADGTLLQGITTGSIWEPSFKRDVVPLYERCTGGEEVDLLVEATAASLFGVFTEPDPADDSPDRYGRYEGLVRRARLARFDPETWGLALDLRVLLGLVRRLPEHFFRQGRRAGAEVEGTCHSPPSCSSSVSITFSMPASVVPSSSALARSRVRAGRPMKE